MVGSRPRPLACVAVIVSALVVVAVFSIRGSAPESVRDFEECVEALGVGPSFSRSGPPTKGDSREANCDARFAGRRRPGGGYTYYDFMQGRNFDIAGPDPTVEERDWIDRELASLISNGGKPLRRNWQKDRTNNSARISTESVNLSDRRWY
jgi:hypothetical protein